MLTCLRIANLAIIERLEVELGPGLNVLTGETGAGKSILVDALELVLGGRGQPEMVRTGAKAAEVEALFEVGGDPELRAQLQAAGLEPEELEGESEVVIRRVLSASGRSRAYVNGRLVRLKELAAIAAGLADISSQHEHHSLADPSTHLGYLDAFGIQHALIEKVASAFEELSGAHRSLASLQGSDQRRIEREDLLRFQLREIESLDPQPGEKEALLEERNRLRHAERLIQATGQAEEALYARDGSICEELARVADRIDEATDWDASLGATAAQIREAQAQLEDAAGVLGRYARGVDADPERLAELDDRLDALGRLERKHGGSIEAVLAYRDAAVAELEELDHHDQALEEAEARMERAQNAARAVALELRKARRKAAIALGTAITRELGSLGMGGAEVVVELSPHSAGGELEIEGARMTARGIDRCELLIAPNPGEEPRPLARIASGGELSRAMLAIKTVLGGLGRAGVHVFDEVDSGVGGGIAEVIGRKLVEVARHQQVICVTHLAQIAVYGDVHLRVRKDVREGRTFSSIERLSSAERLEETARMLGGLKISSRTRAAAEEMLQLARPASG